MIKIHHNIPIPTILYKPKKSKYQAIIDVLAKLKVGDSFVVPDYPKIPPRTVQLSIYSIFRNRFRPDLKQFTTRLIDNKITVWRTK